MSGVTSITAASRATELDGAAVSGPLRAKHMVFVDQSSHALRNLIERIAPSDAAVLIAGESGTGKELVARTIHRKSGRSGPFLAVNCGAISEQLAESELFGHEAGSFTGAQSRRQGWFEAAHGGTLFLDEIGDLPMALQGKLLRVLQEGEVTRIGARRSTAVDVRIVSATNVDLDAAVTAGHFRLDLLYRLNVVPLRLPALRDRPGDVAALAEHFIGIYSRRLTRPHPVLRRDALEILKRYAWPGNIRELENVIHFSLLIASESEIRPEHLRIPGVTVGTAHPAALDRMGLALKDCFEKPGKSLFRDLERRLVEEAYRHSGENQVRTADLLGISRNVVRTLLKRYNLISDAESLSELLPSREPDRYTKAMARPATATPNHKSSDSTAALFASRADVDGALLSL
jgi:transcriptional regulator with PAS, ATPase and Fis domain